MRQQYESFPADSWAQWFLKGDKYLHEDSLNNRPLLWKVGVLLYVCVFVLNEFIWHFTPYTGMGALKFLLGYSMLAFVGAAGCLLISRRMLFGANIYRPDPAIGLPNRIAPRLDYQNVIPPYGENKWLIKRLAAYADLQCSLIIDVVVGWVLLIPISIPYFLLQK